MRQKSKYEAEISLNDLLFHLLYKWRVILIIALIAAGLFGFIEFWSFEKYHRLGELTPGEKKYEADVAANNDALELTEEIIARYDELIQEQVAYLNTSVLMTLDPMNIWTAEKKYYVNVHTKMDVLDVDGVAFDSSGKIMTVLSEAFSKDIESAKLLKAFGTDERKDIDYLASVIVNRDLSTISVVGCGATEEEALSRKAFVDSYLIDTSRKLSATEKFSLEVLGDSVVSKISLVGKNVNGAKEERDLSKIQKLLVENYQNYQNQIASYSQTRNNLLAKTFIKPEPKTIGQAVWGFVIGSFLTVVILLLIYL